MKTIKEFIENLNSDDIELIDKLDNLSEEISETVYELACEKENFEAIEECIKEILQDDIRDTETDEEYIEFIMTETESLYEKGLINEPDDFSAGLYNCDRLYLYSIANVLDLDMSELQCYGDDEEEDEEND